MADNARITLLEHARATLRSLEVSLQSLPLPRSDAEGQLLVALRDGINAADDAIAGERDEDEARFSGRWGTRDSGSRHPDLDDPEDELPF